MTQLFDLVFCGTPQFAVPTLQKLVERFNVRLVVTQPDRPKGRGLGLVPSPVKQAAEKLGLPIYQPEKIKQNEELRAKLETIHPDAIIVVGYGRIIPPWMLHLPQYGNINLHASLLPKYRGAAPIQWAIANGEGVTGVTTMRIDEGLDTGDILLQRRIEIRPKETGGSLHDRLAQIAPEALLESLRLLAAGEAARIPQDNTQATYAPKLKREHGQINWSESAEAIERKIRAFNPWPGAFMKLNDQNLKIFSGSAVGLNGNAGQILRSESDLVIAAGTGAVSLREVQLEGKRRMSAAEFLRGHAATFRGAP